MIKNKFTEFSSFCSTLFYAFLSYRSQLRPDLLMQKYICENDEKNIIKLLKRDGRKEKNFALDVLNFFIQRITGIDNDNLTKMGKKNENDDSSEVGDSKEKEDDDNDDDDEDDEDDER